MELIWFDMHQLFDCDDAESAVTYSVHKTNYRNNRNSAIPNYKELCVFNVLGDLASISVLEKKNTIPNQFTYCLQTNRKLERTTNMFNKAQLSRNFIENPKQ